MKARDLLEAVQRYAEAKHKTPEALLRELPDDEFRVAFYASAELFKTLKAEAVRRGIWNELKGTKVK